MGRNSTNTVERIRGVARIDLRTKRLLLRLSPGEIAVICHRDIDGPCAHALVRRGPAAVVNADCSITGRIPNLGPQVLLAAGIPVLDNVGQTVLQQLTEGDVVEVVGDSVYRNGTLICTGQALSPQFVQARILDAQRNLDGLLRQFVRNTLRYVEAERALLFEPSQIPALKTDFADRHALVVVRGEGAAEDLRTIEPYVREMRPVLVGVDGGADLLLEAGFPPDIIIGDMDSVSDQALRSAGELVVHAYTSPTGDAMAAPGLARINRLGLEAKVFSSVGTSEDIALLLAYEEGADLLVAVGAHFSLQEFMERARGGMASTFLTRLKVGSVLVDAKGVSRLYRPAPPATYLLALVAVAALTLAMILIFAPQVRAYLAALLARISLQIGG
jgi:uncharacterized membrane-anchored protein